MNFMGGCRKTRHLIKKGYICENNIAYLNIKKCQYRLFYFETVFKNRNEVF